ncbi:RidA family protein [Varibaculum prostatecancerukia]|uniref:RidA family protein n=1 Tax=Varibaculum prostatecancerukia TaxID=2811781 RepID=UPI001C00145C|nr:RidA family protein [Varibaculum prostatecancerukia]
MSQVSDRLIEAGLSLPPVATPVAAYTPAIAIKSEGGLVVRTSGQIPVVDGNLVATGLVGAEVSPQDAYQAAQVCALNALAAAAEVAGGLDQLERVLKVTVFVASTPTFTGQAAVANGASDTFGKLFDQPHIRSAVGVASLPLGAPCEVEVEFLARA